MEEREHEKPLMVLRGKGWDDGHTFLHIEALGPAGRYKSVGSIMADHVILKPLLDEKDVDKSTGVGALKTLYSRTGSMSGWPLMTLGTEVHVDFASLEENKVKVTWEEE